jgi:replicative DNA helicase
MWDLEIEGTHTFIGNGVVLHNTALVCQSIMEMARLTIPSLFISLEMPKYRIVSRFVAYLARVDGMRLRAGTLTEEEIARVDQALAIIEALPIYIIDTTALAVDSILHQVRMHRELYGIEAVFVDYLQIVGRSSSTNANVNDSEELGYITQQLRNTAVELEIAAIGLSQQNRQYSGLQSILGSGRISHIADSVIEIEMEDTVSDTGRSVLFKVLKYRDGALGSFPGVYRPQHLYFE